MSAASRRYMVPTSRGTPRFTSSPASEAGRTPSSVPDGIQLALFGQDPVPASPSPLPGDSETPTTRATSGPSSSASSRSAVLALSLENRLRASLDVDGSPEYVLTWKRWPMQSGLSILALRARGRRTSDNASGGWPTPRTPTGGPESAARKQELGRTQSGGGDLQAAALMSGWPTPNAQNFNDGESIETWEARRQQNLAKGINGNGQGTPLAIAAQLAGVRNPRNAAGQTTISSPAATTRSGVLNPAHSRWLMGYPRAWDEAAPGRSEFDWWQRGQTARPDSEATATRSTPPSPASS